VIPPPPETPGYVAYFLEYEPGSFFSGGPGGSPTPLPTVDEDGVPFVWSFPAQGAYFRAPRGPIANWTDDYLIMYVFGRARVYDRDNSHTPFRWAVPNDPSDSNLESDLWPRLANGTGLYMDATFGIADPDGENIATLINLNAQLAQIDGGVCLVKPYGGDFYGSPELTPAAGTYEPVFVPGDDDVLIANPGGNSNEFPDFFLGHPGPQGPSSGFTDGPHWPAAWLFGQGFTTSRFYPGMSAPYTAVPIYYVALLIPIPDPPFVDKLGLRVSPGPGRVLYE